MKRRFFAVAAGMLTGSFLLAQENKDSIIYKQEADVYVTVNKYWQQAHQTGKQVTVIGREALLKNQGKTLASLINNQAGIMINGAENNLGTNLSVYTRGASSPYTAILINGIPVTDPSGVYNYFDLNTLPIEWLEQIEIVRGGQAVLYGTDASAGVINIITNQSISDKWKGNAKLTMGSFGTYQAAAGFSGGKKGFFFQAQANHTSSNGFSTAKDTTGQAGFDKDGFKQTGILATAGYSKNDLTITTLLKWSDNKADTDEGSFRDDRDYTTKVSGLLANLQVSKRFNRLTWMNRYSYQKHKRGYLNEAGYVPPGSFSSFLKTKYDGTQHFAESFIEYNQSPRWHLVAGIEYRKTLANQTTDYGFGENFLGDTLLNSHTMGAYLSADYRVNKALNFEGGLRYSKHSVYGNNLNWNFNPSLQLNSYIRLFANIGSSFRAPSLDELYAPFYGNAGLHQENALGYDMGFQFATPDKKFNIRAAAFARRVKDVIVYRITNPSTFEGKYFNENEQQEEGFETELKIQLCKTLKLTANYTNLNGRGKEKNTLLENFYRRPRHQVNAQLGYTPNSRWYVQASAKAMGKRTDAWFPTPVTLAAFYTMDVYVQYKPCSQFTLFLDGRNLTNQDYMEVYGYNTRKLNLTAGVLLQF